MSHRPAKIIADISVPLTRPRTLPDIDYTAHTAVANGTFWNLLDVKHDLQSR